MPEEFTIELQTPEIPKTVGHNHTGTDNPKISFSNLDGLIEVVGTIPTSSPRSVYNQIKIYIKSPEASLCIYDYNARGWKWVGLT